VLSASPLTVNIVSRRTSCVLDKDLALSRHGPMFAVRMAQEVDVWLVDALWKLLDESYRYLNAPEVPDRRSDDAREALTQWESLRLQNDLSGLNLFWISGAKQESSFPEGSDPNLMQRFSVLLDGLEYESGTDFFTLEFASEAIALTAALARHRSVIFTALPDSTDPDDHVPSVCKIMQQNHIACTRLSKPEKYDHLHDDWSMLFSRTGVNELIWSGLRPAVVHIVSPRSLILPSSDPAYASSNPVLDFSGSRGEEKQLWKEANAFWYPIESC